uniref:Uncharacterized protein n=1 Tax=Arundo donax TaxID=35708 RepID=A0A0A9A0H2_ARUDO
MRCTLSVKMCHHFLEILIMIVNNSIFLLGSLNF